MSRPCSGGIRAFSLLIESEAKLQIVVLTRFLHANQYPSSDQARGHASLENAMAPLRLAAKTKTNADHLVSHAFLPRNTRYFPGIYGKS
jgi:hypothetical protein